MEGETTLASEIEIALHKLGVDGCRDALNRKQWGLPELSEAVAKELAPNWERKKVRDPK